MKHVDRLGRTGRILIALAVAGAAFGIVASLREFAMRAMRYEVFAWADRNRDTRVARALSRPGFAFQRAVATEEPSAGPRSDPVSIPDHPSLPELVSNESSFRSAGPTPGVDL